MKFNLNGFGINNILRTLHLKKVKIYNLKYLQNNCVEFEVEDKDVKKVRRQIANVNFNQTPRPIKNYKKYLIANIGLLLGVFIGIIVSIFMSNFTWQIIVYGTKDLTVNDILQVLENNGIKKGEINTETSEEIETILLNNYDRIAQVSVIREGTAIIINLSEKLVYKNTEFKPIYAKFSGVITNINITTGTINVKVGDYVNAGDVLVLPYNISKNGEKINVKPVAEISATMFVLGKVELNKTETVLERTGNISKEYKYKIFNKNLFSGKNKNSFALFETVVYNENVSRLIPLTRDVVVYHELTEVQINHNFEEERQQIAQKSVDLAYQNLPIYEEMLSEKTNISIMDNKMFAITTLTITGVIHDWNFWH